MSISLNNHEERIIKLENTSIKSNLTWTLAGTLTQTGKTVTVPSTAIEINLIGFDNYEDSNYYSFNSSVIIPATVSIPRVWDPWSNYTSTCSVKNRVVKMIDSYDNNGCHVYYR